MREISGDYKQAFLIWAWESAPDGAQTFRQFLTDIIVKGVSQTKDGRIVINTSGAGQSVGFYIPPSVSATDTVTPVTIPKLANYLRKWFDALAEQYSLTDEEAIWKKLYQFVEGETREYADFGNLRLVTGYQWT